MFLFDPREAQHCQLRQIPANGKSAQLFFGPYRLLQTLGEGEFAKVKLASLESSDSLDAGQKRFAIKFIRKSMLMPVHNTTGNTGSTQHTRRLEKLRREVRILQTVQHPTIVQLVQVLESEKYVGLVMEYAQGGELFDHILARRFLREPEARRMFRQLMDGVRYLHLRDIVHRDLKLENLLLDHQRNVKITDFGFANYDCSRRQDFFLKTSCGSPCYAAPELVLGDGYKGAAADIWSCGVILYAMLCGYLPFDDDPDNPESANVNKLYQYIVATELSFPDHVSKAARDLVRGVLNPDPAERLTMDQIFQHDWMTVGIPPVAIQKEQQVLCKAVEAVQLVDNTMADQENRVNNKQRDSRSISMPEEKQEQVLPESTPNQPDGKNRPPALHIQKLSPGIGGSVWSSASPSSSRPRSGTSPLTTGGPTSIPSAISESSQSSDSSRVHSAGSSGSGHRSSSSTSSSVWNKLFAKRHHVKNYSTSAVHDMQLREASVVAARESSAAVSPANSVDAPVDSETEQSSLQRPGSNQSLKMAIYRGAIDQDLISSVLSPSEMLQHVQNILQSVPTVTLSPSSSSSTLIQTPLPTHRRSSGSTSSLNFLQNTASSVQPEPQKISAVFCGGRVLLDPASEFELTVTWTPMKQMSAHRSRSSTTSEPPEMTSPTPPQCDYVDDSHPSFGDRVKRSWREIRRSLAMLSINASNSSGGSEVKFVIEVCRLQNLPGVYYMHFKRIRGDLWQYKRIYKLCAERFRAISNERFVAV